MDGRFGFSGYELYTGYQQVVRKSVREVMHISTGPTTTNFFFGVDVNGFVLRATLT